MPIRTSSAGSTKGPAGAPTIGTATAGNANASVTFTAPSFSKLPITSYTVTSSPGGITGTGASSPITVSGLSNATAYTFTVTATHANGASTASSASNSATPVNPYTIGATGPGGGKIFYDAGSTLSWGRYMEVAPSNWSGGADPRPSWTNNPSLSISRGPNATIGVGVTQTNQMIAQTSSTLFAAGLVRSYTAGGFTWSLPSIGDMYWNMYPNRALLGSFLDGYYGSSTQYADADEISQNWWRMNLGSSNDAFGTSYGGGTNVMYVRPVRYF